MGRGKLIAGAVSIFIIAVLLTSGVFFYFLGAYISPEMAVSRLKLYHIAKLIQDNYVDYVSSDKLLEGAVKGMMSSLGDAHSIYMDKQMYEEFKINTNGSFGGVGLILEMKDKVLTVVAPIEGTPGSLAGIKTGDKIIKIDSQETAGMMLEQAVGMIRGQEGTQVMLSLLRDNKQLSEITLTRSNIPIKSVDGKILQGNIGYIRVAIFSENTGKDFAQKYTELVSGGAKGIILDLRGDPGGLVTESVKIASWFLPKGQTIVSFVERDGQKKIYNATLREEQARLPVVVLVNSGSASASEIVAGAIQDTGAGILIGTKTYGKGSVQIIKELLDGSAIKITTAKYYTPSGKSIHGVGIEPDVKVEIQEYLVASQDIQLEKAIQSIQTKIQ